MGILVLAVSTRILVPPDEALATASGPAVWAPPAGDVSPRRLPARLACHELEQTECLALLRAALDSLPVGTPPATAGAAWATLLCGSNFDCPPGQLSEVSPRGSVVLHFGTGSPDVAFNVADRVGAETRAAGTVVWTVRWPAIDLWSTPAPRGSPPSLRAIPG
jgi:hypothetical protein